LASQARLNMDGGAESAIGRSHHRTGHLPFLLCILSSHGTPESIWDAHAQGCFVPVRSAASTGFAFTLCAPFGKVLALTFPLDHPLAGAARRPISAGMSPWKDCGFVERRLSWTGPQTRCEHHDSASAPA
jgi:hypothetical protein